MKPNNLVYLIFLATLSHTAFASQDELAGWVGTSWMGNIVLPNKQKMPMGFELYSTYGVLTGNVASPAQGSYVNPVSDIRVEGSNLFFKLPTIGAEAEVENLRRVARGYYMAILQETDPQSQTANALKYVSELSEQDKATYDKWSKGAYTLELKNAGETGWVSLLKTDPTPVWSAVTIPLLAINGDRDIQVPHESHLAGIKASATSSPNAEFLVLKNVNHMMQTAEDGNPELYGTNPVTIDPDIAILIKDWFGQIQDWN